MDNQVELELIEVISLPLGDDQTHVILNTPRGNIDSIFHCTTGTSGVIWVCGALGGLDGPSFGIFTTLSQELLSKGISSLRLDYCFPGDFDQCVLDVLVGIRFLEQQGKDKIALVGHSFGGAVVIMAGMMSLSAKTVVGLSNQTAGVQRVDKLSPRPLLLVHGDRDRNLPARCSQDIYDWASKPKELVIYKGSGHFLRECQQELHDLLEGWLVDKLG